jgi:uncharacterized membrane protein (GlpM family)
MTLYILKVVISAAVIVAVSELARINAVMAGLLASLPMISLMAFIWLYVETRDVTRIADLAMSIFWLVLPSLTLFLVLAWMLRRGMTFALSFPVSIAVMLVAYGLMLLALHKLNIRL